MRDLEESVESIGDYLFSDEEANVFAVLDGASIPGLLDKLYSLAPESGCLFRGELEPDMALVAPYLVRLEPDSEFTHWVIEQGWGNHWGIFATSDADFRAMRRHLRTFLIVYDEEGRPMRFRYYDPRVLRRYLPTCNAEELKTVFGPVAGFLLEDDDPNLIVRLRVTAGSLMQKRISINGGA